MVCGQDHHQSLRVAPQDLVGREPNRGSRVARGGFGHDLGPRDSGKAADDFVAHEQIGEDVGALGRNQVSNASRRLLEQRASAEQLQQLLGMLPATQRPEACAAAARQDDRVGVLESRVGVCGF